MDHTTHEMGHAAHKHSGAQPGHTMAGAQASHDRHAGHSVAMFRDKFWLSFALTIPVVFWSSDVQHWLGYRAPVRRQGGDTMTRGPMDALCLPTQHTVLIVYFW